MSIFTRDPDTGRDAQDEPQDDSERTVRLARKRFQRRQWARRWLAWRRVVVAGLVAGLVGAGVWLVLFSSVMAVGGVQVNGADSLSPAQVRRAAAVPVGEPLATVDLDAVTERLDALPAVKAVDVSRAWPDRVRIDVTEREPVAVVQRGGTLRATDATGVVFRRYGARPPNLPLIRLGGGVQRDALAEAARVAGALPDDLARRVEHIEVRTVDTISLQLRGRGGQGRTRTVRWGSADESGLKARVLDVLLTNRVTRKAALFDVSVPGQPITQG